MKVKGVEIAKEVIRSDGWWRFACGDVWAFKPSCCDQTHECRAWHASDGEKTHAAPSVNSSPYAPAALEAFCNACIKSSAPIPTNPASIYAAAALTQIAHKHAKKEWSTCYEEIAIWTKQHLSHSDENAGWLFTIKFCGNIRGSNIGFQNLPHQTTTRHYQGLWDLKLLFS